MEDEKRSQTGPKKGLSGADFTGMGLQFAFAIVLFLFVGQWIDKRLGFNGLFTIVGVFLGAGGAFYSMYRKVSAAQKRDDEERISGKREAGTGKREQ
jgi:F0F1-type ATP synthase assembly protein I